MRHVEILNQKDLAGRLKRNASKRLAATTKLGFDVMPQYLTRPEYSQGATFNDDQKNGFATKFFKQYRLFLRYHPSGNVSVYA